LVSSISVQSLCTLLIHYPSLATAIDPQSSANSIDNILHGEFNTETISVYKFNQVEKEWFSSLNYAVTAPISLDMSLESGWHMRHYKVMLECIRHKKHTSIPEIVLLISHMSLLTSSPLHRWECASQVMIKKGKGHHIENLYIVQLCEVDMNFILHIIWGKLLMRNALPHLDKAQFAILSQTCHNAV